MGLSPLAPAAAETSGDRIRLTTKHLDLTFALDGADLIGWRACHPSCSPDEASNVVRFTADQDGPQARLQLRGDGLPAIDLDRLRFTATRAENAQAMVVTFEAPLPVEGLRFVKQFSVSKEAYDVVLVAEVRGPNVGALMTGRQLDLELDAGRGLASPPAPGFAAMLDRVHRVIVRPEGVRALGSEQSGPILLGTREWVGVRNRFWALLVHADNVGSVVLRPAEGLTVRTATSPTHPGGSYRFYSGPVEPRALTATDPELDRLFLSGLWTWLRGLSLGLLHVLRALTAIIGNPGVAIIALAGAVKLLLLPLTLVAERLQAQVQATQARIEPRIEAINAAYRGEERTRRTVALYREAGVSPFYTLKSLAGFLIQIPVFIAAFDMLAENFDLQGVPFLWIRDLTRPDALWRMPVCFPFFGCDLNLLPFLMSGISIAAGFRHHARLLTPSLVRKQRRNLTAMSVAFFFLFYTFPAGMVLYWTSTNFVQLVRQETGRLWRGRRTGDQGSVS